MKLNLGKNQLTLKKEGENVRVLSEFENALMAHQNPKKLSEVLLQNFQTVQRHYQQQWTGMEQNLDELYLSIVVSHLYVYNLHKQEGDDLSFKESDFNSPQTYDEIFDYFKKRNPKRWLENSALLIDLKVNEVEQIHQARLRFQEQ